MGLNIGIVGATGMVGEAFMDILSRHNFPISSLRPFASAQSEGSKVTALNKEWTVEILKPGCFNGLDLVFFSSGDDISKEWAPEAVKAGAYAVDNSAAFRMNPDFPLIVPEVNPHLIPIHNTGAKPTIIANPNCSTIQLVVALKALKKFGLEEVRVASYQSVSGAGKVGRTELIKQSEEALNSLTTKPNDPLFIGEIQTPPSTFAHEIAFNCIPQIGSFNDLGFCSEEVKIMYETKKILELPDLKVSAFTVRVPSLNSHSEAVWVTLKQDATIKDVTSALISAEGITFHAGNEYPTSRLAAGQEPVYVGRVHKDPHLKNTWLMWIVADNILKGAALNGLQIAERIFDIKA